LSSFVFFLPYFSSFSLAISSFFFSTHCLAFAGDTLSVSLSTTSLSASLKRCVGLAFILVLLVISVFCELQVTLFVLISHFLAICWIVFASCSTSLSMKRLWMDRKTTLASPSACRPYTVNRST
jgi:hypothetical protein